MLTYMFVCAYISSGYTCICTYIWRPESNLGCLSVGSLHLVFGDRASPWDLGLYHWAPGIHSSLSLQCWSHRQMPTLLTLFLEIKHALMQGSDIFTPQSIQPFKVSLIFPATYRLNLLQGRKFFLVSGSKEEVVTIRIRLRDIWDSVPLFTWEIHWFTNHKLHWQSMEWSQRGWRSANPLESYTLSAEVTEIHPG